MPNLLEQLDQFPPCLVRLVARNPRQHGRRLPLLDLAQRSGLPYKLVLRLSKAHTWADVPVRTIDAFCAACDVNILHPGHKIWYLKRVLRTSNGLRLLSARNGRASPKNILKLLTECGEYGRQSTTPAAEADAAAERSHTG